jgi:crotonobetainyl-CoA:carnitine CoA-transferase CaiB-like acyl-CoA transferase
MSGALNGIRILDLTRVLAGPWATQMLADMGAEVIKIEKPGEGDDTRGWGPPFITNADGTRGDAAYFQSANRGKSSVCIDMASHDGQTLLRELAINSDVVIENFKVGGLKKFGLDYESLASLKPSLIYCSITGFGQTGPYAPRAGYDFMIQGMAGIMSITGQADGMPGAEPMKTGVAFADVFTGLHAVIGIVSALFHRAQTGQGQYIDLALLDTQVSVLANQALNYLVSGNVPTRLGNAHPNIVPYQTFATADGHIIMAVGSDRQYAEYCKLLGRDDLGCDQRFVTNKLRVENREILIPLLAPEMQKRTTAEWIAIFATAAVPCGPINSIDQVFDDPQVQARGLQHSLHRKDGVAVPTVANPIVFSQTPNTFAKAPPRLGEDTDVVMTDILKKTRDEISNLKSRGIIA